MSPEETLRWAVSTLVPPQAIASTPCYAGAAGPEEIGPTDFERRAGRGQSKKWKESVKFDGQPGMSIGRWLAEQGAPVPVRSPCQKACLLLSNSTQRIMCSGTPGRACALLCICAGRFAGRAEVPRRCKLHKPAFASRHAHGKP